MIKTIVVPTDGSDHAAKAVDLAADIANRYGARVVVVHVLLRDASPTELKQLAGDRLPAAVRKELDRLEQIPVQTAAMAGAYAPAAIPVPRDVLEAVGQCIAEAARKVVQAKGVEEVSVEVVAGGAADRILAVAENENADMIVMGSRGLGDLKGLLLGSVSHKVSHLAKCTCVTVK